MAIEPGLGTLLQLAIGTVYTTIAQRVSIDGPDMQVGTADTTHLDSTAKTHRFTIVDNGEIGLTILYDPQASTHQALTTLMITPAISSWKLILPVSASATFGFSGTLTGFKPTGMEVDSNIEAECTIKISGVIAIT